MERKQPNVRPDKREFMLMREVLKVLLIIGITSLVWGGIYEYSMTKLSESKPKIIEKYIPMASINKTTQQINYNNLKVVIKTSKDIKKYFVSYKKYYSKESYTINIREINFKEYMSIAPFDTLTTESFNIK